MATEMGDDPSAWQDGSFNSPLSTLRLAEKYLEQLRDARTQVMLEWEWTGDYPITTGGPEGTLVLSQRGRFLQQLTQTTPTRACVVQAQSAAPSLLATAVFADDRKSAAVHLLNRGDGRLIRVEGIPGDLKLGTLFVIDPLEGEKAPRHMELTDGACAFEVPAGALVTLAFPRVE
jgi:hypothetical protein